MNQVDMWKKAIDMRIEEILKEVSSRFKIRSIILGCDEINELDFCYRVIYRDGKENIYIVSNKSGTGYTEEIADFNTSCSLILNKTENGSWSTLQNMLKDIRSTEELVILEVSHIDINQEIEDLEMELIFNESLSNEQIEFINTELGERYKRVEQIKKILEELEDAHEYRKRINPLIGQIPNLCRGFFKIYNKGA